MKMNKAHQEQYVSLKINTLALMQLLSSKSIVAQDIQCLDLKSKRVVSKLLVNATIEDSTLNLV
jgi:hypothetical protein